jgi:DNA-binding transcriptional regulator LsrR (DeoR family)
MKDLAAEFGIDRRTVSTHLRQAGIGTREAASTRIQMIEAAQLYEADWSSGRLAERFGVSADKVPKMLRRAGVAIRPRRG